MICNSETAGLCILTREDVPTIWKIVSDPDVNRYLNARWRLDYLENEYEWYDSLTKRSDSERAFGILYRGDSSIKGVVFLIDLNFKNRSSHVGYFLEKQYWNKGIATEALKLIRDYSFEEMNLRKLYTSVFEPNKASIRVLEKCGFRDTGRFHSHVFVSKEGFVDVLFFESFNENLSEKEGRRNNEVVL